MESSFSLLVIITIVIIIFINIVIFSSSSSSSSSSSAAAECCWAGLGAALWKPQELSPSRGRAEHRAQKHKWAFYPPRPRCPGQPDPGPHQAHQGLHTQPPTQSQVITCIQVLCFCSVGIRQYRGAELCMWELEAYITSSETWLLHRQRRGQRDLWGGEYLVSRDPPRHII